VGMIVATGSTPFADLAVARSVLELVSDRAASELMRMRSEAAARGRERTFRGLFESDRNAVALLQLVGSGDGEVTDLSLLDANPAFRRFAAALGDDLRGVTLRGVVGDEHAAAAVRVCAAVARGGAAARITVGAGVGGREASVYWAGQGQCVLTLAADPEADAPCRWSLPPHPGDATP